MLLVNRQLWVSSINSPSQMSAIVIGSFKLAGVQLAPTGLMALMNLLKAKKSYVLSRGLYQASLLAGTVQVTQ